MNRILLQADEIENDRVCLSGLRAAHINRVLQAGIGREVRVGIVDGPKGTATVDACGGGQVTLTCRFDDSIPPPPAIALLLALPRPKVLKRLWPQLAAVGVGQIILTNAAKVERNYFATHWLDPVAYRPLLLEGLAQAGETRVPRIRIVKRLKPFLEDELPAGSDPTQRFVAHPRDARPLGSIALDVSRPITLAVGPEGGWTEYELGLFSRCGFQRVAIGARTLRTDTACIALLGALHALSEGSDGRVPASEGSA